MKTISVAVSEEDYEEYRRASRVQKRPIAQLIREAMATYRAEHLERRIALDELPVLPGHRLKAELPTKEEVYGEVFGSETRRK